MRRGFAKMEQTARPPWKIIQIPIKYSGLFINGGHRYVPMKLRNSIISSLLLKIVGIRPIELLFYLVNLLLSFNYLLFESSFSYHHLSFNY